MANQIIIDIGAVANDGTGDPLRTAFNYVNNNFSNVWATGVANSNIAFDGNRILTTNTNGNLVLSPNGIGKVQANVDIVPNANNTLSLGSLTRQWNTVYARNLSVGGNVEFNDLTVDGNLTVTGNIIQIGNIVTDSKTIQLANTALTANAANGSGVTVGANDNIATMLYSSTSNTWNTNIGITATGNITAPYFVGNGSLLTGITSYANANAVAYGQAGWAGNIIPSGNAVYSLGNATNQWNDLYVSNATIFMNNIPLSLTAGNVLTVNGEPVLINDSATSITTTGNITADYFFGDGSQLTNLPAGGLPLANGTSNFDITTANGNATVTTAGTWTWTFDDTGNLTIPGAIISASTINIDNRASGNSADIQLFAADDITLQARDRSTGSGSEGGDINIYAGDSAEDSDSSGGDIQILAGDGGAGNVDFGGSGGFITIRSGQGGAAIGNTGATARSGGDLTLRAGAAGDNNGNADLGNAGGDVFITAGDSTGNLATGGDIVLTTGTGGANASAGQIELNVPSSDAGPGGTWSFNYTGNLNLPANGDINFTAGGIVQAPDEDFRIRVQDADDDGFALIQEVDDGAGNVLGLTQLRRDAFIVEFAGGANPQFRLNENGQMQLPGNVRWDNHQDQSLYVIADNNGDGTVELKTISYANDTLGSNIRVSQSNATISTGNAAHTWTFDNTGNLTVPGQPAVVKTTNTGFEFSSGIIAVDNTNPAVITVADGTFPDPVTGQVTISGVNPPVQANGTWYYEAVEANQFALYLDAGLTQPVDATGWPGYVDGGTAVCLGQHDITLLAGNVTINSNLNNNTFNWNFDNTGNLTLPRGGIVYETGIPFGGLDGNTIALKPSGGTNADQQLLVYPTAGQDFNHLHLTTGNLWNTEMFLGNDDFYVKLANTGNVVINTNDNGGNTYQLNFTPFGEMRTTGSLFIQTPNGVPNGVTAITGSSGSWESNPRTDLATTNGTGAGLTVTVTETGGYASAIAIVDPGSGYANGDVITVTSGSSSATFTISVANNQWILDTEGELTLPNLSLGSGLDEQTVIRSQRKLVPPFRWSAVIDDNTPTVVYNAISVDTTSMKVTMQIQHSGLGFEMFEVFATSTASNTYYTVSNRVAPPTIDASTVVVGLGEGNVMKITVTINSGAGTSWVTYDAVEFGIPND